MAEMDKKTGETLSFTMNLTARDLWIFSMYHANGGFMGVFNVVFTLAALYILVFRWGSFTVEYRLLLVLCVLIFTVWQPLLLLWKAVKRAKSPVIRETMRLSFGDGGLKVDQGGQTAEFPWENMARMDRLPNVVVLYMDRVHAYLLPKRVMEGQEEAFYELARKHLPKERRRRI